MPILFNEEILSLTAAAKEIPGRPHGSTLFRWATGDGCNGVRLEAIRVGKRIFTSREAVHRFLAALNTDLQPIPHDPKLKAKRQREIAAAEKRVRAAGV